MISTLATTWWVLTLASGLGLALRNVIFKVGTNTIDAALASMILSLSMAVVSIAYFIVNRMNNGQDFFTGDTSLKGVVYSVIAGVGVAAANIFLAHSYTTGGQASLVAIVQNGFAISITLVAGMMILGETIRLVQAVGILCAFLGIVMIVKG